MLAHELAHHVHYDIWKGIAFESGLILAGFFVASRLLEALAPAVGLRGVADIAGLPLLMLSAGAVSIAMVPAAHAMSRAFERSADAFALKLTRNPAAFISAMRRLAAQNLAEEHPSRLVEVLFYSHPPIKDSDRGGAGLPEKRLDRLRLRGAAAPPSSCSSALRLRRILPVGSMLITLTMQLFAFLQLVAHVLDAVVARSPRRAAGRRCPA